MRSWSKSFYKYVSREILNHASLSLCKHPHVVEFYEVRPPALRPSAVDRASSSHNHSSSSSSKGQGSMLAD